MWTISPNGLRQFCKGTRIINKDIARTKGSFRGMLEHIDAPYGKGVVTKGALSSCIISNPTRNDAVVMSIYKKTHPERAVPVGSGGEYVTAKIRFSFSHQNLPIVFSCRIRFVRRIQSFSPYLNKNILTANLGVIAPVFCSAKVKQISAQWILSVGP